MHVSCDRGVVPMVTGCDHAVLISFLNSYDGASVTVILCGFT